MAAGISEAELQELITRTADAAAAWVNGNPAPYGELVTSADDFSIMGPFGGPAIESRAAYERLAPSAAAAFSKGTSTLRLIRAHSSGDLLVLILEEQQRTEILGTERRWSLRVTQVYRYEEGAWRVIHRHADPLTRRRSIEEAALLAQ